MTIPIRNNTKTVKKRKALHYSEKWLTNLKTLKSLSWRLTSIYVRLRDADRNGVCKCSTCSYTGFYYKSKIQAGHFVKKSNGNFTEYYEDNIYAQCQECNLKDEQFLMGLYINSIKEPVNEQPFAEYIYFNLRKKKVKKDKTFYINLIEERAEQIMKIAKTKNLWEWKEGLPKYVFDMITKK